MEKSRANLAIAAAAFVLGWAFNSYHTKKKLAPILDRQERYLKDLERRTAIQESLLPIWLPLQQDYECVRLFTGFEKHYGEFDTDYEFWK